MHPYINIAIKAARRAGSIIARYANQMNKVTASTKSSANDFVTNVDKAVQLDIFTTIKRNYPEHILLGEEELDISLENLGVEEDRKKNYRRNPRAEQLVKWIVDPLDGTLNFIHSYPNVAISIAIEVNGVIAHGVIYDPWRNELFVASKGEGAQLDDRRIRVSNCNHMNYALLATGFAGKRDQSVLAQDLEYFTKILTTCSDIRRSGSAALDLAYVACGRLDGFWERGLQIWDIAAGALLIQEAGGYIGDWQGQDTFINSGSVVAGSRKIYTSLLNQLNND